MSFDRKAFKDGQLRAVVDQVLECIEEKLEKPSPPKSHPEFIPPKDTLIQTGDQLSRILDAIYRNFGGKYSAKGEMMCFTPGTEKLNEVMDLLVSLAEKLDIRVFFLGRLTDTWSVETLYKPGCELLPGYDGSFDPWIRAGRPVTWSYALNFKYAVKDTKHNCRNNKMVMFTDNENVIFIVDRPTDDSFNLFIADFIKGSLEVVSFKFEDKKYHPTSFRSAVNMVNGSPYELD